MFSRLTEIIRAIARNRALAIVVFTFIIIILVIVVNIYYNRQITGEFALKVMQTERLYKTQNLISKLERKLAESDRARRLLSNRFTIRIQGYQELNNEITSIGSRLAHPDSSSLKPERQKQMTLLLSERKKLVDGQVLFYKKGESPPESMVENSQDKLMELNAFTEEMRRELAQLLENNIRYLRRKIDISNQVNILLVITAIIAAVYATKLTAQDFLRQKQIEGILRNLNDEKSRLFSILGHDLRSPLSSFTALIYILKNHRREMSDEDLDDCVRQMELTSVNYNKLLEDVLTWSRLQLNKVPVVFQEQNVYELVQETADLYAEQLQQKKIWLHNQIDPAFRLVSDKGMLQVVFRNLISNAIKFTGEGGDIWISHRPEKDFHLLDIKDSGVGMSDAVLRTLFTTSTISMTGTRNEAGTGLGLSICKEFLSKDNAHLAVESKEGKGSIFSIAIPTPEMRKRLQKEKTKNQTIQA